MSTNADLAGRGARGAVLTIAGQLLRIVIQALGVVVMARILTPADFGLVAMVIAVVGVGDLLRDFGLSLAALQAPELSERQRSNLFWLSTALGSLAGLIVFLSSWAVAHLYGDPRLIAITQVVAMTFAFNGIASQYRANLQRSLAFASLVVVDVGALAVGVVVGIVVGLSGFGYWALVSQYVAISLVGLLILVLISRWLPRGFYRNQNTWHFIRFGSHMIGFQLLRYASENIDSMMIGQRFGANTLGYYNRAFQLMTLPLSSVSSPLYGVALPVLARVQDQMNTFNSYLARAQSAFLALMSFVLTALIALAEPIVDLVLGEKWLPVAPIFRILAIAGIFQVLIAPTLWAFVALGLTRANLVQATISRPLMIALVIAASFRSVESVAWAYAIGSLIAWLVSLLFLSLESTVDVRRLLVSSIRILAPNILAGLSTSVVISRAPTSNSLLLIALGLATMGASMAVIVLAVPGLRRDYRDVLHIGLRAIRR